MIARFALRIHTARDFGVIVRDFFQAKLEIEINARFLVKYMANYIFNSQFLCLCRHRVVVFTQCKKNAPVHTIKTKEEIIFHSLSCLLFILSSTAIGLYYQSSDDSMVVFLAIDYEYACSFIS